MKGLASTERPARPARRCFALGGGADKAQCSARLDETQTGLCERAACVFGIDARFYLSSSSSPANSSIGTPEARERRKACLRMVTLPQRIHLFFLIKITHGFDISYELGNVDAGRFG